VCFAAVVFAAGCDARLAGDLTEAQANEVVVALHARGIAADKEPAAGPAARDGGRFEVEVSRGELGRGLAILAAEGLPRQEERGIAESFEEGGLVPTATEERARLLAAIGGELSRTLERIDGVVDARVHVALADEDGLRLDDAPAVPRASVLVRHRIDRPAPDLDAIRALVSGAVQDLDPARVAVLTVVTEPTPAEPALTSVGPISVARGSAVFLKGVLVVSLGIHVLLASLLVGVLRRHRRPRRAGVATG
jgi:type III secretion protein J